MSLPLHGAWGWALLCARGTETRQSCWTPCTRFVISSGTFNATTSHSSVRVAGFHRACGTSQYRAPVCLQPWQEVTKTSLGFGLFSTPVKQPNSFFTMAPQPLKGCLAEQKKAYRIELAISCLLTLSFFQFMAWFLSICRFLFSGFNKIKWLCDSPHCKLRVNEVMTSLNTEMW